MGLDLMSGRPVTLNNKAMDMPAAAGAVLAETCIGLVQRNNTVKMGPWLIDDTSLPPYVKVIPSSRFTAPL
jgi:hypothetical protein